MGKTYTNTHCCKKHNPNSVWYQNRHPVFAPINFIEPSDERIGFWNRLINFIKRIVGQLSPQRVTKPKGELK